MPRLKVNDYRLFLLILASVYLVSVFGKEATDRGQEQYDQVDVQRSGRPFIYTLNATGEVAFQIRLDSPTQESQLSIQDQFTHRTLDKGKSSIQLTQDGLLIHLTGMEPGIYSLQLQDAPDDPAVVQAVFALVPRAMWPENPGPIRFGLDTWLVPKWPDALGLPLIRSSWGWRGLKQGVVGGEYQWEGSILARYAELATENDLSALAILWAPPKGESDFIGNYHKSGHWSQETREEKYWAFPPRDMGAWARYVRLVAESARDIAIDFEIWNEPDVTFFGGDPEDYAELVEVASRAIKSVRPGARIVGGVAHSTTQLAFYERLQKLDIYHYLDVVSIHSYSYGSREEEWQHYHNLLSLRKQLDSYGFDGPIWITELGGYTPPRLVQDRPMSAEELDSLLAAPKGTILEGFKVKVGRYPWKPMTEKETAAYMVRAAVLALAAGVERIYFHRWWDTQPRVKAHRLWDWELGVPQRHTLAVAVLNYWLRGTRLDRATISDDVVDVRFSNGDNALRVAWSYSGKGELALRPDELDWIAYDMDGRRLNSAALSKEDHIRLSPYPIYLVGMKQGPSLE